VTCPRSQKTVSESRAKPTFSNLQDLSFTADEQPALGVQMPVLFFHLVADSRPSCVGSDSISYQEQQPSSPLRSTGNACPHITSSEDSWKVFAAWRRPSPSSFCHHHPRAECTPAPGGGADGQRDGRAPPELGCPLLQAA